MSSPAALAAAAIAAGAPPTIGCAQAATLAHATVKPVWFPTPPPRWRFALNASVPLFGPGLEWTSGRRYVFLGRVPGGANLGYPFPTRIADPYLANLGARLRIYRLAKVESGRLYAEWRTSAHSRADLTYAAARGETLAQFVGFLRSLRPIVWPVCWR